MQLQRPVIVVSGPSGVGKGTLLDKLLAAHQNYSKCVSHTTRRPREGEREGIDYYYVSMAEFEALIAQDGFVEHAKFGENRYGTSKKAIKDITDSGKTVILEIEKKGVEQVKASGIPARFVFIAPPKMSFEVLEQRLKGRNTETDETIKKRLGHAKEEIEYAQTGAHDRIIENDNLDEAYKELEAFVAQS
jgi:guanylate kinase